jgi:hypothetical protein
LKQFDAYLALRHSRAGGNPCLSNEAFEIEPLFVSTWIPACAGMTEGDIHHFY